MNKILTIGIPSYNRPYQLRELLESIDCDEKKIEILICDDKSPNQYEISRVVEKFQKSNGYKTTYLKNIENLGFDGNLRNIILNASSKFILFMGDDDLFIPKSLDLYINFLENNHHYPYILRSYITIHKSGQIEKFKYLKSTSILRKGEETVAWLFKRSVTISGFTINRNIANSYSTADLDGTLLYQIYLMAAICLKYDSIYCDIPVAHAVQSFRSGGAFFGNSKAESGRYIPGLISSDNSINFSKSYFEVARYLDDKFNINLLEKIRREISAFSYPFLSIQRKNGRQNFMKYSRRLEVELGLGCTPYFYIYKWSLYFLGENICDKSIMFIKRIIGYTPNLGQKVNNDILH